MAELKSDPPMVVKASSLNTRDALQNALRAADENTVIIDEASDIGFSADRVVLVRGRGKSKIDPEKVVNATGTPVLNQGQVAAVVRYLLSKKPA